MINKFDENKEFIYENGFYLTSKPYRLGNILAHYELYKKITCLPGAVIELGVFKGASIIQWATFRELLENEKSRKIIGFDTFGEFPNNSVSGEDNKFIHDWNKKFNGEFVSKEELYKSFDLKGFGNVELIKGDILETLPQYVQEHNELKIALLHIDTDVYKPCMTGLKFLFDRVVQNGVVVFDDYAVISGETRAVDDFFGENRPVFHKFSFSHDKPVYMIKS